MIYIVTYDLCDEKNAQDYQTLTSLIKEEGTWAFLGGSSYLVESDSTARQLRDKYSQALDEGDRLFVGTVTAPAAWHGYSKEVADWIVRKLDQ